MCGIFGFHLRSPVRADWQPLLEKLGNISESRGKEACGFSIRSGHALAVLRWNRPLSHLLKQSVYREFATSVIPGAHDLAAIGHTRLVTNGDRSVMAHNQPVTRDGVVLIHNGIVCNYAALWHSEFGIQPPSDLDSEVLTALLARGVHSASTEDTVAELFGKIEGDASFAALFEECNQMLLATNTGSLYIAQAADGSLVFASQHSFLSELVKTYPEFSTITQLSPRSFKLLSLNQPTQSVQTSVLPRPKATRELKRCTLCILPETFPGITFDAHGACDTCRESKPFTPFGREALEALCAQHRRSDGKPDCLVAFSGGRDSSYALHYLVKEMGMHPITYTYDWGMVTDLARRNIARMCGKLGIENILVSADIPKKREYIRMNVNAWLHRPELGMVSLFMAGDKQFFFYPPKINRDLGISLTFFASNRLEQTGFKSGFCGVSERSSWYLYVPIWQKLRMLGYFVGQYLRNPRYFNRSLLDTAFSFYCAYALKNDFHVFYDYIDWDENLITSTLKHEYNWETESHSDATWRIGDGTAAFYNYIYLTLAGFTEHDTFRSAQIRQGTITRDEALAMVARDNVTRYESMKQYATTVGLDLPRTLQIIDNAPRLY